MQHLFVCFLCFFLSILSLSPPKSLYLGFHQFSNVPYSLTQGNVVSFVDTSFPSSGIPVERQFFLAGNIPYWGTETPLRMCLGTVGEGVSASPVVSSSGGSSSGSGGPPHTHPSEIDRIMAKIDQDNRILAELDKTRSTIGNYPPLTFKIAIVRWQSQQTLLL